MLHSVRENERRCVGAHLPILPNPLIATVTMVSAVWAADTRGVRCASSRNKKGKKGFLKPTVEALFMEGEGFPRTKTLGDRGLTF